MRFSLFLIAGILMSAFTARDASADSVCSLQVNPSSYVPLGQVFSYHINIEFSCFGPIPPGGCAPFTIVFRGSKNGVADIPPSGEYYPGTFGYGGSDLTGFQNPSSGGLTGTYLRYAEVRTPGGYLYCVTNTVAVVLQ